MGTSRQIRPSRSTSTLSASKTASSTSWVTSRTPGRCRAHKPTKKPVGIYRAEARTWWGQVQRYWERHYNEYVAICNGILARIGGAKVASLRQLDMALWAAGGQSGTRAVVTHPPRILPWNREAIAGVPSLIQFGNDEGS